VQLTRQGLDGKFGFCESIDYRPPTPPSVDAATLSRDVAPAIVRAFFAHHQGMSLVAMANILLDDVFVERFHADPRVKATELLLQERVPREAILAEARPAEEPLRHRRSAPFRRGASGARTQHPLIPISCRTAGTRWRLRMRAAGRARGRAWQSPVDARTARRTPAGNLFTSEIRGRARCGRQVTSRFVVSRIDTRRSSSSKRRHTGGATAISKRSFRWWSLPRTTSRCAGCRSRIVAIALARSR